MYLRLFRHFIPAPAMLLVLLDALFVVSVLAWAQREAAINPIDHFSTEKFIASWAVIFFPIAFFTMVAAGLYALEICIIFGTIVNRLAFAFILTLASTYVLSLYLNDEWGISVSSPVSLVSTAVTWFTWVALTRSMFAASFTLGWFKRRILVLGNGTQATRIMELAHASENQHFVPVIQLQRSGERTPDMDAESLTELASRLQINEIVVAISERRGLPVRELLQCKMLGIKITEFLDFWERETRTIDLDALTPSWLFYSDGFRVGMLDEILKRAFDVTVSVGLLVFTLPLQIATAGLIKLESPGPVFYRQERVGRYGGLYTMLKFRSMRMDAEQDGRPRWAAEGDPRVTRVGRFIRRYRIDELPQLINVLRGDMSFVGPRPERPFFVEQLSQSIPYYAERHSVRPGITGWAQINCPYGASVEDARRKLSFDLYYMKNRSIFLDFLVLLKTGWVIFSRSGAR